jgi:hypothetical protein
MRLQMHFRSIRVRYLASVVVASVLSPLVQVKPALALTPQIGAGSQYATTHVYVAPADVDAFVASFLATFGGTSTKQVVTTVTPMPSSTTP